MTPQQAIAKLDRQLSKHGQTVTLRREATTPLVHQARAFVRKADPENLTDAVSQDARVVVLSPTSLPEWAVKLQKGDQIRIGEGALVRVEECERVLMDDQLVRINAVVQG